MRKLKKNFKKYEKYFLLTWKKGLLILASWILAALLHNLIYGLFQSYFDARGGDEFIFFIIAVFIIPLYFIVCLVYSIIFWIKKK
jgi:hypothetical protein